ncbi:hypothetical protein GRI72_02930 [Altererythrobacter marinus]|uniref:Uncharacterized protein n=1 Tax=Pelagerythrobacter marinus TaxID=538382 RepID=A0ABW9UWS2_9SPHN|nr:hypothetical protein [Pelagerythrobacter marinus]MXO67787.1 hypothetical protein [Pelagerythrobacter marinus]
MRWPLPPFLPDQLPRGDILTVCKNVYPAQNGYRPVGGFESISQPLPATFKGGASFISTGGGAFLLAGTSNGLVRLYSGVWSDLLTSLTVPSRWKFAQFGDYVVCVNGGITQQVNLPASSASAIAGAPTGTDVTVIGDHVIIAQPDGDNLKVAWSAFNDHTSWTPGVDQAGEQIMLTGGEVMGVAGGEYGVILQRQRLVRMSRTGDADAPFQFDEISTNFGCASKASIVQSGRTVFFLSDRGFIALDDGQAIRPIGNEKFDRSFREQLGEDAFENIWAAVDPKRTLVIWGIPGVVGTAWVYDWALDRASTIEMPFDGVFAGFENSIDLDALAVLYPDLDAMPYTLDDPRWSGGAPRLYFVQDGEVGTLEGQNMTATLKGGRFTPNPNRVTRLRAVWPDTDAIDGVTVNVTSAQRRGDAGIVDTGSNLQPSGRIPLQARGKYMDFETVIANDRWTYIEALELEQSAGGLR